MARSPAAPSRQLAELTSAESARLVSASSILCLPLGSIEQHGPHLPLNGQGGNRGVLETLLHELTGDFGLNACAIHPFDLAKIERSFAAPDVHGGQHETSVMLALAPDLVRRELAPEFDRKPDTIRALI